MCSGITRGRLLNAELYAQRFQKLIYLHLFTDSHEDFSPIVGTNTVFVLTIKEKSSWDSLYINAGKLTSETFVHLNDIVTKYSFVLDHTICLPDIPSFILPQTRLCCLIDK